VTRIDLENGKYTVLHDNGAGLHALRYGEPWRDMVGDGLVLAMAQEIEELQAHLLEAEEGRTRVSREASKFEDRMGDLQVKCGKLESELAAKILRLDPTGEGSHPIQPVTIDPHGIVRFKENKIVSHLLEFGSARGCSLNELVRMGFSQEDHMQLAQLIGYSVSGYGDLSYASPESVEIADFEAAALLTLNPTN
jgi:hypothetical protein